MIIKKITLKIALFFIGFIICIVIIFYFSLQSKLKGISDKFPYNVVVNKELKTKHVCYLYLMPDYISVKNPYRLQMGLEGVVIDETKVYEIPIKTFLYIKDAISVRKSVSGTVHNLVLGEVFVQELNKKVAFEFSWGENPTFGFYDDDKNYDIYDLAPWQEKALPYKYFWNGSKQEHDWIKWKQ